MAGGAGAGAGRGGTGWRSSSVEHNTDLDIRV